MHFLLLKWTDQREKADVLELVSVVGPQPLNALCSLLPVQMSTAVRPVDSLTGQSVSADTLEAAVHRQRWEDSYGTVWWGITDWEVRRESLCMFRVLF